MYKCRYCPGSFTGSEASLGAGASTGDEVQWFDDEYDYGDYEDATTYICALHDNEEDGGSDTNGEDDIVTTAQAIVNPTITVTAEYERQRFDYPGTATSNLQQSELLSLKLLQIVDEFNLPRAAYQRIVGFMNNVITKVENQYGTSLILGR
ncbi:hypothetical protein BJV82DRAFT_584224 [Fennellomyces sp. T-0311]|nr:hypothetical protein BJV82DRAFT_584224 [Fennellomyces sp. T-0311]